MVANNEKSSYRHIIKSTTLFGGVQIIQIIASLVKNKFAAIFIGATGMGISSLLVSSVSFIQTISSLGLNSSGVREISSVMESNDKSRIDLTIRVYRRWIIFSALAGLMIVIISAYWLSEFVFESNEYFLEYVFISLVVAFNVLGGGFAAILQGTHRLKDLAKSSMLGAFLSVLIMVPFYYFFRLDGIVPALIFSALVSSLFSFFYSNRIKTEKAPLSFKKTFSEGNEMVKLGVVMMMTSLMGTLTILLINTFIKRNGTFADVGLYQAGMNITSQSISLVFTAMGVDYFPRLSAISNDSRKVNELANQQSEIMILIVTPILMLLIILAPILVRVLLSKEFLKAVDFIRLISVGMFFQAANFAMGYISFAKGDKKTFVSLSLIGNVQWLILTIIGYYISGLMGIGVFYIIHHVLCTLIIYYAVRYKYQYILSTGFIKMFVINFLPLSAICILIIFLPATYGYFISFAILCFSIYFSFIRLNEMIGLKEMLGQLVSRTKTNNH